jgi:general secretion pathway protein K
MSLAVTISRKQPPKRRSSNERAAALIAVLCLLSLLTVLALGALNAARRHARMASTSFALIQQREFADSALRLTILELSDPYQINNRSMRRRFTLFDRNVTVEIQREAGRIDLNFADELLLTAAFAGNGIGEKEARGLAARIIDWRDADDMPGQQGAERGEYRLANRPVTPRNGPFETVSELLLVMGAEQLSESLLDTFTVYSHLPNVTQDAAGPEVMNALRWAQAQQLGVRTWLRTDNATGGGAWEGNVTGEVLRLRACTRQDVIETCRVAVVRLTGDPVTPALVFVWL